MNLCANVKNLFLKHPHSKNMTYVSHLFRAWGMTFLFMKAVFYSFVHGMFPFLFEHDSSDIVLYLYYDILNPQIHELYKQGPDIKNESEQDTRIKND
jgi:hypothetical protein